MRDRETLQALLRDSPSWWSALFGQAGVGIVVVDGNGAIRNLSPSIAMHLGYAHDELVAGGVEAISEPEDLEREAPLFRELIRGQRDAYQLDRRYRRADGEHVWGRTTVVAVPSPEDPARRWGVALVVDITHQREFEARLRRFVAEASHEIRGPIATVVAAAELLQQTPEGIDSAERRELVDAIVRRGRHLQQLSQRMLELGRIEHGLGITVEPVRLASAVRDALETVALEDVELHLELTDAEVEADHGVLVQVFANLLSNALRYGAPPIEVAADTDEGVAVIDVRDHGEGLSDRSLHQLFQPFGSAASGAGLGLAITRTLLEAMGGTICYEPADPGARFSVRLPVVATRVRS